MNELVLAQQAMRLFGKDAIYQPDTDATPCRVQVDEGVVSDFDNPSRETVLTFLVSEFPRYEPRAVVSVPELGRSYSLRKLLDDDGYLRSVSCARL